jgi:hypothetical protein
LTAPAFSISIDPVWGTAREIRAKVGALLISYSAELRLAVMMTTSELLENAIKYGESVARAPRIVFSLGLADGVIRVETVNGCSDHGKVQRLQARLQRMAIAEDPKALYLSSIRELPASAAQSGGSGLGLYRIAAEGGFTLSCHYEDGVVGVIATRSIA